MDSALKQVQERFGVDIPSSNGDDRFELPLPGAFLVSSDGKILKSFVEADYMKRLAPETAIQWIDELVANKAVPHSH